MTLLQAPVSSPRFGANYMPSQQWAHAWLDLDLEEVKRDLEDLAALGLDHIRVLPLWPVLQPNRSMIRQRSVDDVRAVVDVAAEQGMDASVDVLQGHLSSFDFLPAWLHTWHRRNLFTQQDVVSAEVNLVTALGSALADAPNFLGLTVGNEVNQFSGPPHPSPMPATHTQVARWLETLIGAARKVAPGLEHLHAVYDAAFYLQDHPFTPAHVSRIGDLSSIHSWIFNGTAQRYGGASAVSAHHAEYLMELSRAFALDPQRPIWLQEVGAPSNCLTEEEMPDFLEQTLWNAVSSENLWGVTWWCSHDVSRSLADFPELEYTLGLIDSDHQVKPLGRRYANVIEQMRRQPPLPAVREVAVEIQVDEADTPVLRPSLAPGGSVFEAWMEQALNGTRAGLVLSSQSDEQSRFSDVISVTPTGPEGGYSPSNTVVEEDASS